MQLCSAGSTDRDPVRAVRSCFEQLDGERAALSWLLVFHSEPLDSRQVARTLGELAGIEAIQGGTSCQGVMTQRRVFAEEGVGLGVLAISDPAGTPVDYRFLEVNPAGEYLFASQRTGQPIPQAIAAALERHDRAFGGG